MTLDPVFVQLMTAMLNDAIKASVSGRNQGLSVWFLGDTSLWSGDPLDIASIAAAFSRAKVGTSYSDTLTSEDGTVGDAASCTLQSDYLAMVERAFRMRHSSPIRSEAHATARKLGHSAIGGCIDRVKEYAQSLINAGEAEG